MLKGGVKLTKPNISKSASRVPVNKELDFGSGALTHNTVIQKYGLKQTFTYDENDWLLVADGSGKQEYFSRSGMKKTALKWGQLKLFISELQFLNKYWKPEEVANPVCVYIGAASGNHIVFLARMFPQITFELYDGRAFDSRLESEPNVKIYQKLFDDLDIKKYENRNDVFLICDIRSLEYNFDKINTEEIQRKNEEIVKKDMDLQMDWTIKIKPVKAHLKFRLPYGYEWNIEKTYTYLDGDIYKQPFSPLTTTETRLVPDLSLPLKPWDFRAYESMMFYHNNVVREHIKFINPLTGINEDISPELGLLQDFESASFVYSVKEYLDKFLLESGQATNTQVLQLCKAIIDDVGANTINLVNLRSGLNGTLTSVVKSRMRKVLDEEDE